MKFHRIEGKLPVGATLRIDAHTSSKSDLLGGLWKEQFIDTVARHSSNAPLTFTLDVPENVAAATAGVLRKMADELMLEAKQ